MKKMKQQAGFKEGPTVDTKREALETQDSGSESEKEDEKPQVHLLFIINLLSVGEHVFFYVQAWACKLDDAAKQNS